MRNQDATDEDVTDEDATDKDVTDEDATNEDAIWMRMQWMVRSGLVRYDPWMIYKAVGRGDLDFFADGRTNEQTDEGEGCLGPQKKTSCYTMNFTFKQLDYGFFQGRLGPGKDSLHCDWVSSHIVW